MTTRKGSTAVPLATLALLLASAPAAVCAPPSAPAPPQAPGAGLVTRDQLRAALAPYATKAEVEELKAQLDRLRVQMERLRAELDGSSTPSPAKDTTPNKDGGRR